MKREDDGQDTTKIQFSEILRERKVKFLKDQRVLDRLLKKKLSKNNLKIINPQKFLPQQPEKHTSRNKSPLKLQDLEEQNGYQVIEQVCQSPRMDDIRREYHLQQKAQCFIQRLKKQKEYNQGRLLLLRKKEEERKEQQKAKMEVVRKQMAQSYHRNKIKQIMSNIMLHEQRVSFRADQTMAKELKRSNIRAKTENAARSSSVRESLQTNRNELPKIHLQNRK